jgi:hypothetical protein
VGVVDIIVVIISSVASSSSTTTTTTTTTATQYHHYHHLLLHQVFVYNLCAEKSMNYPPSCFNNNCMHIPFWDHFAPTLSQIKVTHTVSRLF